MGRHGLAGLSAVALFLVAQRWGSYLGFPQWNVFIADLLLLAAAVGYVRRERLAGLYQALRGRTMLPWAAASTIMLFAVGVVRLVVGSDHSPVALRDAAPFIYVAVAFLAAGTASMASQRERDFARHLVVTALVVHLLWVVLALSLPNQLGSLPSVNPDAPVRFLQLRFDVDGAFLSVLAAWGLSKVWRQKTYVWFWLPVSVVSVLAMSQLISRVGPLALVFCSFLAVLAVRGAQVRLTRRLLRVSVLMALVIGGLTVLPSSPAFIRWVDWVASDHGVSTTRTMEGPAEASTGVGSGRNVLSTSAMAADARVFMSDSESSWRGSTGPQMLRSTPEGTARARWKTWRLVWSESVASPGRIVFGVGFGANIVADAGATAVIGASPESNVRSPHNFLLTVFARTGVIGVLALVLFLFMLVKSSMRVFRNNDQLSLLGLLLIVALLIGSLFGVIMESPFGAVPVYWAAGIIMASATPPLRAIRAGHVTS
jgi:hypothetical protein